jgi:DNA invertase Pin-like site-specific DNA recombinase
VGGGSGLPRPGEVSLAHRGVACPGRAGDRHRGDPVRAVTYRRASTREQGDSGLGLEAQRATLARYLDYKQWAHIEDFSDVSSARKTNGRKGLKAALALLDRGEADVLVVSRLDRLSRSVVDFGDLMARARKGKHKWAVVALDLDIDTTTATGRCSPTPSSTSPSGKPA